jgi:hypothetical protein
MIRFSRINETALEAEAQTKSGDERIELISWLQETAASYWNLIDYRVCIRNIEEVCNWFKSESFSYFGRT